VGIGLLGHPDAVPELLQWLREEKAGANRLNDMQLSFVAAALGKIGRPGPKGEVVAALRDQLRTRNRLTRTSAVIALGQVAPGGDEKVQRECVDALCAVAGSESRNGVDGPMADFALIALGRVAGVVPGRDGTGGCPAAVRTRAIAKLVTTFQARASNRSFAALGLGLATMNLDGAERAQASELLRDTLARTAGDVEQRGGMCIALGLMKDMASAGVLQSILLDRAADSRLRGIAAIGLGLIGDKGALEPVREVLGEKEDRDLRVNTAIAAGLLRDRQAVDTMVDILKDTKSSQFVLGSAATALGQIGDRRAVEPLASILQDGKYPDLLRALSCVALGQIGSRSDLPVLARLSKDVDYRAYYDALTEVLSIL
jgi:HEAT repeat protein